MQKDVFYPKTLVQIAQWQDEYNPIASLKEQQKTQLSRSLPADINTTNADEQKPKIVFTEGQPRLTVKNTSSFELSQMSAASSQNVAHRRHSKLKKSTMSHQMMCRLFLDGVFILFTISSLQTGIGYVIPYVFLPNRGLRLEFDSIQSSWLISAVGISNTIGRFVFGFIARIGRVNALMLYSSMLVMCGICSVCSVLLTTFPLQICYALCFGFLSSTSSCVIYPLVLSTCCFGDGKGYSYLHYLITVRPHRSTHSSSLVTLTRPPTSSPL